MKKADGSHSDNKKDGQEKARQLSPAEQRRQRTFDALSETMAEHGYRRVDLTISIAKANVFAVILLIPLMIAGIGLFLLKNRQFGGRMTPGGPILFAVALIVLVVVHELIHGLSWAVFAEHHWKDIEFGFIKQNLTPYCTCSVPLSKEQYIFGAMTPLVVLGILPMIAGILTGSFPVLFIGIIMADAAAGDIMIVREILRYRSRAARIVYIDHPTQAGGVIFEK